MVIGPQELEEMLMRKEEPLAMLAEEEIDTALEDRFNGGRAVFNAPADFKNLRQDHQEQLLNKYRQAGWQVKQETDQKEGLYLQFERQRPRQKAMEFGLYGFGTMPYN